ncbi:MAG: tRNA dimethylallyltransferase [uncultured Solirubrobacteraceae bacterium]|uniref:tRNA dimethylallyltransferase n=1 Tax=uncultured Solirubrobacteraceae bacterium TaxID=1162706 RepID=A0A6J4RM17_9ACTN|nr:MAG: tRNA dimethylallyltransferase [uncultured Solirubrobacteraceae bacterium]
MMVAVAPTVFALFGPTGVGKTALAIAVADRLRARGERPVAVSADALQVYAGLETLTGVATPEERARLEHRLVAFLPVTETFSAGRYAQLAHREIDGLVADGATPIVVGGTGLYLRAALTELALRPQPPPGLREQIVARLEDEGAAALHAGLVQREPWTAETVRSTDTHRLIRTLELEALGALTPPRPQSQLWTTETRHPTRLVACVMERTALHGAIAARVERMVADGAADQVRRADAAGASPTARKALGFQELLDDDPGGMLGRTRRYARRQVTWLRKLPDVETVDLTDRRPEDVAAELLP